MSDYMGIDPKLIYLVALAILSLTIIYWSLKLIGYNKYVKLRFGVSLTDFFTVSKNMDVDFGKVLGPISEYLVRDDLKPFAKSKNLKMYRVKEKTGPEESVRGDIVLMEEGAGEGYIIESKNVKNNAETALITTPRKINASLASEEDTENAVRFSGCNEKECKISGTEIGEYCWGKITRQELRELLDKQEPPISWRTADSLLTLRTKVDTAGIAYGPVANEHIRKTVHPKRKERYLKNNLKAQKQSWLNFLHKQSAEEKSKADISREQFTDRRDNHDLNHNIPTLPTAQTGTGTFKWNPIYPGKLDNLVYESLRKMFKDKTDVEKWANEFDSYYFSDKWYDELKENFTVEKIKNTPIRILVTHAPTTRNVPKDSAGNSRPFISDKTPPKDSATGMLVTDQSILAVDLFSRIGKHKFVFCNTDELAVQCEGDRCYPDHLQQNYWIDILIKGKKDELNIEPPWYESIDELFEKATPTLRPINMDELVLIK